MKKITIIYKKAIGGEKYKQCQVTWLLRLHVRRLSWKWKALCLKEGKPLSFERWVEFVDRNKAIWLYEADKDNVSSVSLKSDDYFIFKNLVLC